MNHKGSFVTFHFCFTRCSSSKAYKRSSYSELFLFKGFLFKFSGKLLKVYDLSSFKTT